MSTTCWLAAHDSISIDWSRVMKQKRMMVGALLMTCLCLRADGEDQNKELKVDAKLSAQAEVVLRVELLKPAGAVDKYGWDQVKVLDVLKNEPKASFPKEMGIAFRNTDPGVPKGESTVYLVPYRTPPDGKQWRLVASSHVTETKTKAPFLLDLKEKNVQRLEVSQSQIGFTATKVFYTAGDQQIVVVVNVDNSKKEFPVTCKLFQFDKDVTPDDLAKWVNNQHSDAVFPDVPKPRQSFELPAKACRSSEIKLLGQKTALDTTYNEYSVDIEITDVKASEQVRFQNFKDTVKVYAVAK